MDKMNWKPIFQYENRYEISDCGLVRSLVNSSRTIKNKRQQPLIKKTHFDKDGYIIVSLYKNRTLKQAKIHRLIAAAFIPNPQGLPCINHKNGNKTDNSLENLEWTTFEENTRHAWQNGFIKHSTWKSKRQRTI